MKNLLVIMILFTMVLACKKDNVDLPVYGPANDYADSLVGTYMGHEIRYDSDNNTKLYENTTKTMSIIKLGRNRIQLQSFYQGPSPIFTLSIRGDGDISLTPEGMEGYSSTWNSYTPSAKQLNIYVKDGIPWWYYYLSTKQ